MDNSTSCSFSRDSLDLRISTIESEHNKRRINVLQILSETGYRNCELSEFLKQDAIMNAVTNSPLGFQKELFKNFFDEKKAKLGGVQGNDFNKLLKIKATSSMRVGEKSSFDSVQKVVDGLTDIGGIGAVFAGGNVESIDFTRVGSPVLTSVENSAENSTEKKSIILTEVDDVQKAGDAECVDDTNLPEGNLQPSTPTVQAPAKKKVIIIKSFPKTGTPRSRSLPKQSPNSTPKTNTKNRISECFEVLRSNHSFNYGVKELEIAQEIVVLLASQILSDTRQFLPTIELILEKVNLNCLSQRIKRFSERIKKMLLKNELVTEQTLRILHTHLRSGFLEMS